jgi:DNA-binding transcriptional regulator YhcF (GntR family)
MTRRDHRYANASEEASAQRPQASAQPPRNSAQPPQDPAQLRQEPISAPRVELGAITIDRAGEIPIGVQLAWALRARIRDGRLRAGQRLPGLRDLAEMLGINANTVRGVYQRLEREGLIDSRQGTGTFVASAAVEHSTVVEIAADAAREARRTGVDPRDVAAVLYVTAEPHSDPRIETAQRRKELRAQIAALEQALSEIQTRHPGLIGAPSRASRYAGPRLLDVEELEQVRTSLLRRLAAAEPPPQTTTDAAGAPARARRDKTRAADGQQSAGHSRPAKAKQPAVAPRATPRPSTA